MQPITKTISEPVQAIQVYDAAVLTVLDIQFPRVAKDGITSINGNVDPLFRIAISPKVSSTGAISQNPRQLTPKALAAFVADPAAQMALAALEEAAIKAWQENDVQSPNAPK